MTTDDWRIWRPVIWLTMLGVAVALVAPPYWSGIFFGAAIGFAIRIQQRRRRLAAASRQSPTRSSRRGKSRAR